MKSLPISPPTRQSACAATQARRWLQWLLNRLHAKRPGASPPARSVANHTANIVPPAAPLSRGLAALLDVLRMQRDGSMELASTPCPPGPWHA
jgi:hypothetical protein